MLRRRRVGTSTADVTNRRTQLRQLIDRQALTTVQISGKLQQQLFKTGFRSFWLKTRIKFGKFQKNKRGLVCFVV